MIHSNQYGWNVSTTYGKCIIKTLLLSIKTKATKYKKSILFAERRIYYTTNIAKGVHTYNIIFWRDTREDVSTVIYYTVEDTDQFIRDFVPPSQKTKVHANSLLNIYI